jgi:hypothetical protein
VGNLNRSDKVIAKSFFDTITGSGAIFTRNRKYRYALWRVWNPDRGRVLFVMLNPSIADEVVDDPTQGRCRRFARDWGFGGYMAANIFAYISTDPKEMREARDPVCAQNDAYLKAMHGSSALTVAAWGNGGAVQSRGVEVLKMLHKTKPVMCLSLCKNSSPKHPLYLKANLRPRPMKLGWLGKNFMIQKGATY